MTKVAFDFISIKDRCKAALWEVVFTNGVLVHSPDSNRRKGSTFCAIATEIVNSSQQCGHCRTRVKRSGSILIGLDGKVREIQILCHSLFLTSFSPEQWP